MAVHWYPPVYLATLVSWTQAALVGGYPPEQQPAGILQGTWQWCFTAILQVLSSVKPTPWGVWSLFFWKVPHTLGPDLHSAALWERGWWCTELRMEAGDFPIMP
ncbi:hypothetical protein AOLI_G00092860 [Acnodon oligacanthus]